MRMQDHFNCFAEAHVARRAGLGLGEAPKYEGQGTPNPDTMVESRVIKYTAT
jgi:hypothetical protein